MSNPAEQTLGEEEDEEEEEDEGHRGSENDNNNELSEEWETMARAWLCSFPEAKAVSMAEVEAWIDSNFDSLPEGIKSMPRSELCQRLISIQNCMRLPNQVLITIHFLFSLESYLNYCFYLFFVLNLSYYLVVLPFLRWNFMPSVD